MGVCGSRENVADNTHLLQTLAGHDGGINCLALSADGSVVATGSEDRTARIWTSQSEECECIGVLSGHDEYINCITFEDNFVLTGSADKTIRKWDVATCDCILIFYGHTSLINRIISTGEYIFSSSYDRTARCWDFETGDMIRVFSGHKRGVYPLIFVAGSDDGRSDDPLSRDLLVTGSADFTGRIWSFETGKCTQTFRGHEGAITCMSMDPRVRYLYTGSTDQTVRSWRTDTGEMLKVFEGHQGAIICMTLANKILYTGSSDHTARAWVTEFGTNTRTYKGHRHTVSSVKIHRGLLVTTCGDASVRVFSAKSAQLRITMKGHDLNINAAKIVGERLFTASHDCTLRVWSLRNIHEDGAVQVKRMKNKKNQSHNGRHPQQHKSRKDTRKAPLPVTNDDEYPDQEDPSKNEKSKIHIDDMFTVGNGMNHSNSVDQKNGINDNIFLTNGFNQR